MDEKPLSAADVGAVIGNRGYGYGDGFGADGGWVWIILLFALFGGSGFGWGNNGNYATKSDVYEGLYNNNILSKLDSMTNQVNGDFNSLQLQTCQGFNQTNLNMMEQFNASNVLALQNNSAIARQLDNNRYAMQQEACDIRTAIYRDGEETRALIVNNKIADLEGQLLEKNRELQTAQLETSQLAQTSAIINAVRPYPVPSYTTLSPYMSNVYASGYNGGFVG